MQKTMIRDAETAALVKKTARISGYTRRQVYMVINGDRKNEYVLGVYMALLEGGKELEATVKEKFL